MALTQREFFELVQEGAVVTAEMAQYAVEGIAKLDRKNAQRRSAESKTEKANAPLREQIFEMMSENVGKIFTAPEVAGMFDYSSQKATSLLRRLVTDGLIEVTDVKVKGKGKQKGYFIEG